MAGYILSFGISSGEYVWSTDLGNVTKYEIPTTWPEDHTYYVGMRAYNTAGLYSEFSDELPFVINPSDGND